MSDPRDQEPGGWPSGQTPSNPEPSPAEPEGAGLDDLFREENFREVDASPLGGAIASVAEVRAAAAAEPKEPKAPREPLTKVQRILLWVAVGLLAALALVAFYFLGTRLSGVLAPAPEATPTPTPTAKPTAEALPLGPVEPGEYAWDELLGGECLEPFTSPWDETFTVVDCATPHTAQMVYRGVFPDPLSVAFPGADSLQARMNLVCTPPTIIDYAAAGAIPDAQFSASYPVTDAQWDDGARTFWCFVTRSSGDPFTGSIAVPQTVPPAG